MGITEIIGAVTRIGDDMANGRYVTAWGNTLPVQQFAVDTLLATGLQAAGGASRPGKVGCTDEERQRLRSAIQRVESIAAHPPLATEGGPGVAGIFPGDGSVLKAILSLLTTILPLIL